MELEAHRGSSDSRLASLSSYDSLQPSEQSRSRIRLRHERFMDSVPVLVVGWDLCNAGLLARFGPRMPFISLGRIAFVRSLIYYL